jgi:biopolymer transport protein ExbB
MSVTLFSKGGPLMWLILFNAALALMIFFERLFHYHRAHIHAGDFVSGIRNALGRGNDSEAVALCEDTPGPVAHVVKTAVINRDLPTDELREMLQDVARVEVSRLEKRLVALATIAQISPLIGFLGTVMGMISLFMEIQKTLLPSPGELAGGIWVALLTTAGGLAIAVPSYVGYNYLVTRVQNMLLDMEHATNEILGYIAHPSRARNGKQPSTDTKPSSTSADS